MVKEYNVVHVTSQKDNLNHNSLHRFQKLDLMFC